MVVVVEILAQFPCKEHNRQAVWCCEALVLLPNGGRSREKDEINSYAYHR